MSQQRVSRQDLYREVWSTPLRTLAPKHGLSGVSLAKLCTKYKIPRPEQGHWTRVRIGKSVEQPPLLPFPGMEEIVISVSDGDDQPSLPIDAAQAQLANERIEAEKIPENLIVVPRSLLHPHPLVEAARQHLTAADTMESGILISRTQRYLDIRVTKGTLDRALRIMDALVKALEKRAMPVTENEKYGTQVSVLGEDLSFGIEETLKWREVEERRKALSGATSETERIRIRFEHPHWCEWTPTGSLSLKIKGIGGTGCRQVWHDSTRRQLENSLNSFIVGLAEGALATRSVRLDRERWKRQYEEEKRREREMAEQRAQQEARLKELEMQVANWNRARQIREYAEAAKAREVERNEKVDSESDIGKRIAWMFEQADRLDPLR